MTVRELRLVLTVEDFDAALAFYRDALGLEERDAWEAEGGGYIDVVATTLERVASPSTAPTSSPCRTAGSTIYPATSRSRSSVRWRRARRSCAVVTYRRPWPADRERGSVERAA